jgi:hypothetical protein
MIAYMVKLNGELQLEVFRNWIDADSRYGNVDGGWEIVMVKIEILNASIHIR